MMEINLVEYFVCGFGYIKDIVDIEEVVIQVLNNVLLCIKDIVCVSFGFVIWWGIFDKLGVEVVGGVVVVCYGVNLLEVIDNVKVWIVELELGFFSKVLDDGMIFQVKIIFFYDCSELINEIIGILEEVLSLEVLIMIIVVIFMLFNFKLFILVVGILLVVVLMCFIVMCYLGVDVNIVVFFGIVIVIGMMVDMGIVFIESIFNCLENVFLEEFLFEIIYEVIMEVVLVVIIVVVIIIISFLLVFMMEVVEGKFFCFLVYIKIFVLVVVIVVVIIIFLVLVYSLMGLCFNQCWLFCIVNIVVIFMGLLFMWFVYLLLGVLFVVVGVVGWLCEWFIVGMCQKVWFNWGVNIVYVVVVVLLLV